MTTSKGIGLAGVGLAALMCLSFLAPASRADASIYWGGAGIGRADLDGSNVVPGFVEESSCGVAVDDTHLYWSRASTAPSSDFIGRASLPDGTGVDPTFIRLSANPGKVAVDGSHIYWTNPGAIGRANLSGSYVDENFIPAAGGPAGVAVGGGHIYWTEGDGVSDGDPYTDHNRTIGRANLDGSNIDPDFIDPPTTFPDYVAMNATHIFWTAGAGFPGQRIARANLDGTGIDESFITGANYPHTVAVDATHIYWGNGVAFNNSIGRADIDGSNVNQNFIPGSTELLFIVCDVALDAVPTPPSPPPGPPEPPGSPPSISPASPTAPASGLNRGAAIKKCKKKAEKKQWSKKKLTKCKKQANELPV